MPEINPSLERPQPTEYNPFYNTYISLTGSGPILQTLERLKESTYQFFSTLPLSPDYTYATGKWTIKEVTGHMIDAERIFAYRASCISRGEQQNLSGFDQDEYVATAHFNQRTLESLLTEFKLLRESNLHFLKALTPEQWLMTGTASGYPISVRALIHIMAGHELHHLKVIKEKYLA